MTAVWTYPWTIKAEGLEKACEEFSDLGIDEITVSSHYHSVRSLQPRFPDTLFQQFHGGCHFSPDPARFDGCPIVPQTVTMEGFEDPLAEVTDIAHDHGLSVNAWMVCLHNSRLGAANPDYRIESAFGDSHDHSLCPSHPAVRDYFARITEAIVDRSVDEIQLESIGVPNAFHSHGLDFGHDKRQVLTESAETVLFSQCFCDGCRRAAKSHPIKFDHAKEQVKSFLEASFADPTTKMPSLGTLVDEESELRALFDFRASIVEALVEEIANAAGTTPLNYYVAESPGGANPNRVWPSGVKLARLDAFLDRATAMCYVSNPAVACDRVRSLQDMVDCSVDAGLSLDPSVVKTATELSALVDALADTVEGRLSFYHYSLLTDRQLQWIGSTI